MRIIAGKYRGKKLREFEGTEVRPTSDRAREGVFSVLQFQIEGKRFLDGFCGSGAIGIEALSRGAKEVVFTDLSKKSCELTNYNLKSVGEYISAKNIDVLKYLSNETKPFDIIFLDPPYNSDAGIKALNIIAKRKLLNDGGVVVFESGSAFNGAIDGLILHKRKKYGIAEFAFFKNANQNVCVFAGSFDPVTKGHVYVTEKALEKYQKVIVLLAINANKNCKFDRYTRQKMLEATFENYANVQVDFTDGLLVDYLRERSIIYNVRGIRNQQDMLYEEDMFKINSEMYPEIKNVYINASESVCDISSTVAREQLQNQTHCDVLPDAVNEIIKKLK